MADQDRPHDASQLRAFGTRLDRIALTGTGRPAEAVLG